MPLLWKKSEILAPQTIKITVHVCGNDARAPTSLILKPKNQLKLHILKGDGILYLEYLGGISEKVE